MNIEEIKSRWLQKESNENDNINLWNEKADYFGNYEGSLPEKEGRNYYECDIDSDGGTGERNGSYIPMMD